MDFNNHLFNHQKSTGNVHNFLKRIIHTLISPFFVMFIAVFLFWSLKICICVTKFLHQNIKQNSVMKGHSNYPLPFLYFGHNFIAHTHAQKLKHFLCMHTTQTRNTEQTNLNDPAQGSWSAR